VFQSPAAHGEGSFDQWDSLLEEPEVGFLSSIEKALCSRILDLRK
jgi:hypothetical protein